ncbi:MAG: hypothetical protein LCI03_17420 [Actinobacteria bacterium]|nr:hypothetical protein [Actinomycetota bacterium]
MRYPSPTDSAHAPVWGNYVVAQASQASLGIIPRSTLAFGVVVEETSVTLRFLLADCTPQDVEDMDDIVSELEALLGPDVLVTRSFDVRDHVDMSPHDRVRWVYAARDR